MKQELFQQTLRSFLQREPFLPFVVELRDGRKIAVDEPTVAFAGAGVYFSPAYDLHDFKCEDVFNLNS